MSLLGHVTGREKESPRKFFFYFSDDGDVLGMRYDNWKMVFVEQRCKGTLQVWAEPFTRLRLPKIFNLRTDPYEFADITSNTYWDWMFHNAYFIYAAQAIMRQVRRDVQGIPLRAEAEHLHGRRRPAEDGRKHDRRELIAKHAGRRRAARHIARNSVWMKRPIHSPAGTRARRNRPSSASSSALCAHDDPDYIPPDERIAVFDNDGTLWCEYPMQVQVFFALAAGQAPGAAGSRVAEQACVQGDAGRRPEDAGVVAEEGSLRAGLRNACGHDAGGVPR